MTVSPDIRDQAYLSGNEVKQLNFIKDSSSLVFRKYYRSGLRSHIFEVLAAEEVQKETQGEIIDGVRMFPRARPLKMFRILRNRFKSREAVFLEIEKYNILLDFLGPDLIACSEEFMADYSGTGTRQIVLCGLQEYVEGHILDPWRLFGETYLRDLFKSAENSGSVVETAKKNIALFIQRVKQMISGSGYIPDLAGIGNLILTPLGNLKLVDINNIVSLGLDPAIRVDDKGYPSCDVSVQVLSILEQEILQKKISPEDPLFQFFLAPERKKRVKAIEEAFYKNL